MTEQPWKKAIESLIEKLKHVDKSFIAGEHDRYGMRNFIQNTTHPGWKKVIEESQDDVQTILDSFKESIAA